MPAGFHVASAYVDIHAESAGLRGEIKRAIEGAVAGDNGKVKLNVDASGLRSKVSSAVAAAGANQKVKVEVNLDTAGLRAKVSAAMAAAGTNQKVKVQTNLDTAGLRSKVSAAIAAAGTNQKVKVGLKLDTAGFRAAVSAAVAAAGAGQYVHVGAKVDTAGLRAAVSTAVAEAGAGQRVHVGVDVDRSALARARSVVSSGGSRGGGGGAGGGFLSRRTGIGGLSRGAVLGGLSMLEPVMGALIGPIKAVGTASAALVPAFLGSAVAATALVVGSKGVGKAMKASNKDADDYGKALNNLAPSAQEFVRSTSDMGGAFDQMRLQTQQALFAGLGNEVTKLGGSALPIMTAGLVGMAGIMNTAFKGVTGTLGKLAGNGQLAALFGGLQLAFKPLAQIPGQLIDMLTKVGIAASPLLARITNGIAGGMTGLTDKLTKAFDSGQLEAKINRAGESVHKFFTNFRDNGAVQQFMQNMKTMGPQAAQNLQKIGEAGLHLLNNASPIGSALLKIGGGVAGIVNAIPSPMLSNMLLFASGMSLIGRVSPALSSALPKAAVALGGMGRAVQGAGLATVGGKLRGLGNSLLFVGGANRMAAATPATLRALGANAAIAGAGAATAVPKLGALKAGLGLLAAGVVGASLLEWSAGLGQKAIPTAGKMTQTLMGLTASGKLQSQGLKALKTDWVSVGKALEHIISPDANERIAHVLEMGDGKNSDLNRSKDLVKNLDKSLADMVSKGYGAQAGQIFKAIKKEAGESGLNVNEAAKQFKKYKEAVKDQAANEKIAAMTMGTFGKEAVATSKVLSQNSGEVKGLQNSYDALGKFQAGVIGGQLAYNQTVSQADPLLKKHSNALSMQGGLLNTTKPKAQDAATAMLNMAEATRKAGDAFTAKGDYAARLKLYDDARTKMLAIAQAQGLSSAQAKEFVNQVLPVDRIKLAKSAVAETAKEYGTLATAMSKAPSAQKMFNFKPNTFTSQARAGLDSLKGVVTKTLDNGKIQVKVDTAGAKRQVGELSSIMTSLKSKGTQSIKIPKADVSSMITAAKAMGMQVKNMGGGKIKITAEDGASVILNGVIKKKKEAEKPVKIPTTLPKGSDTLVGKSLAQRAKEAGDPLKGIGKQTDKNADSQKKHNKSLTDGTTAAQQLNKSATQNPALQTFGSAMKDLAKAGKNVQVSVMITGTEGIEKLAELNKVKNKSIQVSVAISGTEDIGKLTALNAVKNKNIQVSVLISGTEDIGKLTALNAVKNKNIQVSVLVSGTEDIGKLTALNDVRNKFIEVVVNITGTEGIDKLKALNEVHNKSIDVAVAISGTEQIAKLKALNEVHNKSVQVSVSISGTEQIGKLKALNEVHNKNVAVSVSISGTEQIGKLKALNEVHNKSIAVSVSITGTEKIDKLKELNKVANKSISVNVNISGADQIAKLQGLNKVSNKTIKITVTANVSAAQTAISGIKGKPVKIAVSADVGAAQGAIDGIKGHTVNIPVTADTSAAQSAIDAIHGKTVTITVNVKKTGSVATGGHIAPGAFSAPAMGFSQGGRSYKPGGNVNGIGSGTSDSIMARLSNGEFVIRAAMVKKYGPEFLAGINHGAYNPFLSVFKGGKLGRMFRGFADGGSVSLGNVQPGDHGSEVLLLQKALKEIYPDFDYSSGAGTFGPKTQEYYSKWQKSLGYSGSGANGSPGIASLTALANRTGEFSIKTSQTVLNYVIKYGDTLTSIAKKFGTSVDELVKLNHISDPNKINAGSSLKIPSGAYTPGTIPSVIAGTKPGDWNYLAPPNFSKIAAYTEKATSGGSGTKDASGVLSIKELVDGRNHFFSQFATHTNSADLVNKMAEATDVKGIAESLDAMRVGIYDAFKPGKGRDALQAYGNTAGNILIKYEQKLVDVNKSLEDAKKAQDDLQSSYKSLNESVAQTVTQFATLVKTGKAGASTETMIRQLTKDAGTTSQFRQGMETLKMRGLNGDVMAQIGAAGPVEGLRTINSLLKASPEQIAQINALQTQVSQNATKTGTIAADAMYGAGLAAANGFVDGLNASKGALEAAMKQIAEAMKLAIRQSLGIASPSKVMHGYGINTIQGLVRGMTAEGKTVPEIIKSIVEQIHATAIATHGSTVSALAKSGVTGRALAETASGGNISIDGGIHVHIDGSNVDLKTPEDIEKFAKLLGPEIIKVIREENRKRS